MRIGFAALLTTSLTMACTGGAPAGVEPTSRPDPLPVCRPGSGELRERWVSPTPEVGAASFAIAAGRAAISKGDGTVGLWSLGPDAATFDGAITGAGTAFGECRLAFDGDAGRLAASSLRGVDVWDVETDQPIASLDLGWDTAVVLAVSDDGAVVAVASSSQVLHVWTPQTGEDVQSEAGFVEDLAFVPGTHDLVVEYSIPSGWSPNPSLVLLDAETSFGALAEWHLFGLRGIAISGDGKTLVGVMQGAVGRFDLTAPEASAVFAPADWLEPLSVSVAPDGASFAVVGAEGTVRVFSTATLEETARRDVALQIGGEIDEAAGGIVTVGRDGVLRSLGCE